MACRRSVVTFLTLAAFAAGGIAQDPPVGPKPAEGKAEPSGGQSPCPPQGPKPSGPDQDRSYGSGEGKGRREWKGERRSRENLTPDQMKERAMRDLEKLTPEQRHEVWRAVWAVLNMPQEKKQELIGAEDDRRKKVREEIERTLQAIGIKIPDDQRRRFFHRYFTGRRGIEEQLKKESEERRQVLMKELDEKLKQEFGNVQQQVEVEQNLPPK
jgi:hypothetical protein